MKIILNTTDSKKFTLAEKFILSESTSHILLETDSGWRKNAVFAAETTRKSIVGLLTAIDNIHLLDQVKKVGLKNGVSADISEQALTDISKKLQDIAKNTNSSVSNRFKDITKLVTEFTTKLVSNREIDRTTVAKLNKALSLDNTKDKMQAVNKINDNSIEDIVKIFTTNLLTPAKNEVDKDSQIKPGLQKIKDLLNKLVTNKDTIKKIFDRSRYGLELRDNEWQDITGTPGDYSVEADASRRSFVKNFWVRNSDRGSMQSVSLAVKGLSSMLDGGPADALLSKPDTVTKLQTWIEQLIDSLNNVKQLLIDYNLWDDTIVYRKRQKLKKPTLAENTFEYISGKAIEIVPEIQKSVDDLTNKNIEISGDLVSKGLNDYKTICSIKDTTKYEWEDGSTEPVELSWKVISRKMGAAEDDDWLKQYNEAIKSGIPQNINDFWSRYFNKAWVGAGIAHDTDVNSLNELRTFLLAALLAAGFDPLKNPVCQYLVKYKKLQEAWPKYATFEAIIKSSPYGGSSAKIISRADLLGAGPLKTSNIIFSTAVKESKLDTDGFKNYLKLQNSLVLSNNKNNVDTVFEAVKEKLKDAKFFEADKDEQKLKAVYEQLSQEFVDPEATAACYNKYASDSERDRQFIADLLYEDGQIFDQKTEKITLPDDKAAIRSGLRILNKCYELYQKFSGSADIEAKRDITGTDVDEILEALKTKEDVNAIINYIAVKVDLSAADYKKINSEVKLATNSLRVDKIEAYGNLLNEYTISAKAYKTILTKLAGKYKALTTGNSIESSTEA